MLSGGRPGYSAAMERTKSPEKGTSLIFSARRGVAGLLLAGGLLAAAPAGADPLDQLTGMENWNKTGVAHVSDEWKDWRRLRGQWREARRDIRLQRAISQRLARLLSQPRGPSFSTVKSVLQLSQQ